MAGLTGHRPVIFLGCVFRLAFPWLQWPQPCEPARPTLSFCSCCWDTSWAEHRDTSWEAALPGCWILEFTHSGCVLSHTQQTGSPSVLFLTRAWGSSYPYFRSTCSILPWALWQVSCDAETITHFRAEISCDVGDSVQTSLLQQWNSRRWIWARRPLMSEHLSG